MAQTPEGRVKDAIKKYLASLRHCWFFLPVSNGMGSMGIPDIICCYRGIFVAIETKAPGKLGNVTPLQRAKIDAINNAEGFALAVDCVAAVRELIAKIDRVFAEVGGRDAADALAVMRKMGAM